MKTLLCWFSGTGNSLWAARALGEALGETELLPIARTDPAALPKAERIGFVFPVYAFGPPRQVADFIAKASLSDASYLFAVMTYGSDPGSCGSITRRMFRRRGATLDAAFGVHMVENYPPFGLVPPKEKQGELLSEAEQRPREVASAIEADVRGHIESGALQWRLVGPLAYRLLVGNLKRIDRKFRVDPSCNGCGICAKACPTENIRLVDEEPTWLGKCEQCYACYHWCPQEAVQYGKQTVGQARYHHPACKANDLF